jgi:HK97 gp10 family phage protein
MKIDFELKGLEALINNIKDYEINKKTDVSNIVKDTALKIQANAKQRTPVKSGTLKRSIGVDIAPDEMSAEIGTNEEYAPHVEFGTSPHTITVNQANVLSDGKQIYGKEVKHPGTKAQPFLFPAYEQEIPEYKSKLAEALRDVK